MPEPLINLSTRQVQALRTEGRCTWRRACQLATPLRHATGTVLLGRESVAEQRIEGGPWLYEADGRQPGRFYLKNYLAPRQACRLRVVVVDARYEQDEDENWAHCFTLQLLSDASVLSA